MFFWITIAVIIFGISLFLAYKSMRAIASEDKAIFAEDGDLPPQPIKFSKSSPSAMAKARLATINKVQDTDSVVTQTIAQPVPQAKPENAQKFLKSVPRTVEEARAQLHEAFASHSTVTTENIPYLEKTVEGTSKSKPEIPHQTTIEIREYPSVNLGKYIGTITIASK